MSLYYQTHLHQIAHSGESGDRDDHNREIAECPFVGCLAIFLL